LYGSEGKMKSVHSEAAYFIEFSYPLDHNA
jgi:hypothetical protein